MEANKPSATTSDARPTLLSKPNSGPRAPSGEIENRILTVSKLGSLVEPASPAKPYGARWKVFAFFGAAIAIAWAGYQYLSEPAPIRKLALTATPATAALPKAAAANSVTLAAPTTPVVVAAPATVAPPESAQAAQIINEIPRVVAAALIPNEAKRSSAAAVVANVSPERIAVKKEQVAIASISNEPARPKITPSEKRAIAPPKTAIVTGATTNYEPSKSTNTNDQDVNLLAALIAHTARPTGPSIIQPVASNPVYVAPAVEVVAAVPPTTNATTSPSPSASTKTRNLDVVDRQPSESTDSLLARCRAFGFLERELCRLRICSGQWDTDTACSASLSNRFSHASGETPVR